MSARRTRTTPRECSAPWAALLAGLLGSPHCAGMRGGFATACSRPGGGLPLWHAGRLTTYAVFGALAASFGAVLPGPAWVPGVLSVALLAWFALALAGLVPEPAPRGRWVGRAGAALLARGAAPSRFAFGLLNGLLPCGMVYAALSIPIALAEPAVGALAMVAFGLGTIAALTLFPALFRRIIAGGRWRRRVLAALVLTARLASIGLRTLSAPDASSHSPARRGAAPAARAVSAGAWRMWGNPLPFVRPYPGAPYGTAHRYSGHALWRPERRTFKPLLPTGPRKML